jgi:hypothetical protein
MDFCRRHQQVRSRRLCAVMLVPQVQGATGVLPHLRTRAQIATLAA